jgi:toxin ParE1/3/4
MNYFLRFHPELQGDLARNYEWYVKKDIGLAREFLVLFFESARKIQINPLLYMKIKDDFRRFLMKTFPYAIYYYLEEEYVIITGLFHCTQNPNRIVKQISKRKK